MSRTAIEWADRTWNMVRARNLESGSKKGGIGHFCEHVSEGCRNCYAEALQPRFRNPIRYARQDRAKVDIFLDEETLLQPLKWREPSMIFPVSMSDLFGDWVTDAMLDRIFAVMMLSGHHRFLPLTKREIRAQAYLTDPGTPARIASIAFDLARARHPDPDSLVYMQWPWPLWVDPM